MLNLFTVGLWSVTPAPLSASDILLCATLAAVELVFFWNLDCIEMLFAVLIFFQGISDVT